VQEAGVLHRRRADDDVGDAVVEVALDGVQVADAAAELDRDVVADRATMALITASFFGLPANGAVEVDQVQAAGALVQPVRAIAPGLRRRPWRRPCRPVSGARSGRP
jgi:hypothetical protein